MFMSLKRAYQFIQGILNSLSKSVCYVGEGSGVWH